MVQICPEGASEKAATRGSEHSVEVRGAGLGPEEACEIWP